MMSMFSFSVRLVLALVIFPDYFWGKVTHSCRGRYRLIGSCIVLDANLALVLPVRDSEITPGIPKSKDHL
ncbi:hypothetical protein PILCRDRAFT_704436 [Piloderma croceum F 1598]|uniref:Secreted protein n=1 Tax=Piloderma croceum (strain F 1598) TaxID=765440 RepID=A0A0C3F385_PILCF|nr:hypothetical protein PILCRDRAFT_704436 [Piloderma croceum F 1598]